MVSGRLRRILATSATVYGLSCSDSFRTGWPCPAGKAVPLSGIWGSTPDALGVLGAVLAAERCKRPAMPVPPAPSPAGGSLRDLRDSGSDSRQHPRPCWVHTNL